jgi:hypothetical protein
MKKTKQILSTFALLAPLAFCQPAKAEGIDCTNTANYMDSLICTNSDVRLQDDIMAKLYSAARLNIYGNGSSGEVVQQKAWLSLGKNWIDGRSHCLEMAEDRRTACVLDEYKARNLRLAFASMPKNPDLALQVLRDQSLEPAPYYEALAIFTSEPDGTDWTNAALAEKRTKIETLIGQLFKSIHSVAAANDPNKHFAIELFDDAGFKNPGDVLKSSSNFAKFLRAATFDKDATLPCGYIVSHQELLDATEAYFGATPDNSIMKTNCGAMAPATPKFHALLELIDHNWPQCDGTIRFAAYRSYSVAIDRVLTPSAKAIENFKFELPRKQEVQNTLEGVSRKSTTDAETEMANYYSKYLGVTHAKARTFAKSKIADVLYHGHQCE